MVLVSDGLGVRDFVHVLDRVLVTLCAFRSLGSARHIALDLFVMPVAESTGWPCGRCSLVRPINDDGELMFALIV